MRLPRREMGVFLLDAELLMARLQRALLDYGLTAVSILEDDFSQT